MDKLGRTPAYPGNGAVYVGAYEPGNGMPAWPDANPGVGPAECLRRNPRLVYGRMTGWGQVGPRAAQAGHDLNYLSLTGTAGEMLGFL